MINQQIRQMQQQCNMMLIIQFAKKIEIVKTKQIEKWLKNVIKNLLKI